MGMEELKVRVWISKHGTFSGKPSLAGQATDLYGGHEIAGTFRRIFSKRKAHERPCVLVSLPTNKPPAKSVSHAAERPALECVSYR